MDSLRSKQESEKEAVSGSREVIDPDKNRIIEKIEKNKDAAILHEQKAVKPDKPAGNIYDDGSRGPSSD